MPFPLIAALTWKGVAGSLLRNWELVVIGVLLVWLWLRGNTIEDLETDLAKQKQIVVGYENALATVNQQLITNVAAMNECRGINQVNADEGKAQLKRGEQAKEDVAALRHAADLKAKEKEHEAQAFEGRGLDCPAFDDEFLRWLQQ